MFLRIDQATADTLNKALDLAKQGVVAAFETVKQYAPVVWGMARRQVLVEGIQLIFGAFMILGVAYAISKACWYKAAKNAKSDNGRGYGYHSYFDEDCAFIATCTTFGIAAIPAVILIIISIPLIFNPDWATMQRILELVRR